MTSLIKSMPGKTSPPPSGPKGRSGENLLDAGRSVASSPDYRDLFEHAPAGYMVLDVSGRIRRINQSGAGILGWDAVWLAGKDFERWVVESDKSLLASYQRRVLRRDGALGQELCIKNREGRIIALRLESARNEDAAGDFTIRCTMIDVSGEQQSARKLRQLQSQLAHVTRLHTAGELASSLAHELNQPLGTVVLNCENALRLLERGRASDFEFAATLNEARDAASFASDVVRHLRGFLCNNGEAHMVCQVQDLILDVATLIRADARDNGVELQLDIEPNLPAVQVNQVQIEQVLLNLAHNGIEAMRESNLCPGMVIVSARRTSASIVQLSVVDTGPGIDASQFSQVFTPFFSTKPSGMGMGLSICRNIVEAHGGRIWVDPGLGSGAAFHVALPAIGEASEGA